MSRVGKNPVPIPSGVTVDVKPQEVAVKGPKGNLTLPVRSEVKVSVDGDQVVVERSGSGADRQARALHGTTRAHIANMIKGVTAGFEKKLEIVGVGYKADLKGKTLNLSLGYSHPIDFPVPDGITIKVEKGTSITVSGIDKQQVGQVAAVLRGYRKPDAYKGKGVRYADEEIRLKAGKSGK